MGSLGLDVGGLRLGDGLGGHDRGGRGLRAASTPTCAIVAVEPMQCPTLHNVGFGAHRIEGIGDKHVTWIHNVWATDLLVCVDDLECLEGLQLLQEGSATLEAGGRRRRRSRGAGSTSSASAASATSSPRSARPITTASGRGRRS